MLFNALHNFSYAAVPGDKGKSQTVRNNNIFVFLLYVCKPHYSITCHFCHFVQCVSSNSPMITLLILCCYSTLYIPTFNHFLGWIAPWKHLLNNASERFECLLTTWLIKDLNLAQITFPFPLNVVVALQYRWFSQGLIHSASDSQPFSLQSFERTFLISRNKAGRIRCCTPLCGDLN